MMLIYTFGNEGLLMRNTDWGELWRLANAYGWEPHGLYKTGIYAQLNEGVPINLNDPRYRKKHPDRIGGYFCCDSNEMIMEDCHAFASALLLALSELDEACETIHFFYHPDDNNGDLADTFFEGWAGVAMAAECFFLPHGQLLA